MREPAGLNRSPLRLASAAGPVLLFVLAAVVLWQLRATGADLVTQRARVATLERREAATDGPKRHAEVASHLAAARAAAHDLEDRQDWLTWALGGLMLPAIGLAAVAGVR